MSMTISDIAKMAGVSRATVSGVLNNNPNVGKKTKLRVLAIIEKYNYKPNEVARALARRQTGLIGLLVKDISNPLYSQIALGVEDACGKEGYSVIMGNSQKDHDRQIANIGLLKRRRVDGLIIFPLQKGVDHSHIRELKKEAYPFVLLAEIPGIEADLVRADDENGAFEATRHLIQIGRRNIACVTGPVSAMASDRRLDGYQNALVQANIKLRSEYVIRGGWRYEHGYHAGKKVIRMKTLPEGVLCYNDSVAIGLIRALVEHGCRIPDDVAVIGFDGAPVTSFLQTALTTVAQPAQEIGVKAAELLLKRITNKDDNVIPEKIFLETKLIVRETCGVQAAKTHESVLK
jgi:DNA-binding LacI/PurR family transcriptional regulator